MMACTGTSICTCGCCAGTSVQTPQLEFNRSGLSALSYRVGTWAQFKESMLARLSSADYPALQPLKTRSDDDFTIAFIDATATVLDILTFYQERLANEAYLRTATQTNSLIELSRLIGYQPAPGVSAATYLAFTLRQTPGTPPDPKAPPIVIPQGTNVQSVPPQGQQPQTFETAADILAKPDWNALQVQTGLPWGPQIGDTFVYLAGTSTQLQPGDAILVVGNERAFPPYTSENWDVRIVSSVTADTQNNRTCITWKEGLGSAKVTPAQAYPKFYAFRQRASLFGYNAIQPMLLDQKILTTLTPLNDSGTDWNFLSSQASANSDLYGRQLIDLDSVYTKIVPNGWIALIVPDDNTQRSPSGLVTLYQVESVTTVSRSDYGTSARITRAAVDVETYLDYYYWATRQTLALVQSEALAVVEQPLRYPLYGTLLKLETLRSDLGAIQVVAVSGNRQKLSVNPGVTTLWFIPDDGSIPRWLAVGEVLTLMQPPDTGSSTTSTTSSWQGSTTQANLYIQDQYGRTGTVQGVALGNFAFVPAARSDPQVSEYALVVGVDNASDPAHTTLKLQSPLANCYDRPSTTVNANVGLASHGRSVSDILGNGGAATPNQMFTLKQSPLTFVQAATHTGSASTLQVQVNGVTWTGVASLYNRPPGALVYANVNQADGTTDVLTGDGVEGSTLPTGQNNVRATYRIGSGAAGNVPANSLITLADRPLGVSGVSNPEAATGGQDPQSADDIRSNAPQTVLTLGRAVSITDYQNYASTFAGIAKAYAIWIPYGPNRGVFLTVAGTGGAALLPGNPTLGNLITSLQNYGNPLIPIIAETYVETLFTFSANVRYDPEQNQPTVLANLQQTLSQTFGFATRSFGQSVSIDEIAAVIQAVPGVIAVNVFGLTRGVSSTGGDLASLANYTTISTLNNWQSQHISLQRPFADTATQLYAYLPVPNQTLDGQQSVPQPAEILVMNPEPNAVVLGILS
jgi:hypothetical protein